MSVTVNFGKLNPDEIRDLAVSGGPLTRTQARHWLAEQGELIGGDAPPVAREIRASAVPVFSSFFPPRPLRSNS